MCFLLPAPNPPEPRPAVDPRHPIPPRYPAAHARGTSPPARVRDGASPPPAGMAEPLPRRSLPIPPPHSLRQERERKEKEAALRCWEGLAELPLCGGDLVGRQDGAQPLPHFPNQSKTKQPGELAQLPVPRGRDAAGREAVLWDDSCQHLWWVTFLPRHGDSKGHPPPGWSEERGRQPALTLALCSSPPRPPRGTPRPPSDALPTPTTQGVGKRRSAAPQGLRFLFCSGD